MKKMYFEVGVQYLATTESGNEKMVKEYYAIDAQSFTEAEAKATGYMGAADEFAVISEVIAPYEAILTSENPDDPYFKVKVMFITIDEVTAKEKRTAAYLLVQAESIDKATSKVHEYLKTSLLDYVIDNVATSKVSDLVNEG